MPDFSHRFRRRLRHPYTALFLIAVTLRLLFFAIMSSQLDTDQMATLTEDTKNYLEAAQEIRDSFDFRSYGVFLFGPGYPAAMAGAGLIVGLNPAPLMIGQIVLSALTAVLLAMLAQRLTGNRRIGIAAGLVHALSPTSISLANILLSETLFIALVISGLYLLLRGLNDGRRADFLWSGLLLGGAALTRSMGQFLFLIVILVGAVYVLRRGWPGWRPFFTVLIGPLVGSAIMLAVIGGWVVRNHKLYDMPYLAASAPTGLAKLTWRTQAKLSGTSYEQEYEMFMRELSQKQPDSTALIEHTHYYPMAPPENRPAREFNHAFLNRTDSTLGYLLCNHFGITLGVYLDAVFDNVHNDWGMQYYQLPENASTLRAWTSLSYKKGFNYRVSIFALIGVVMLARRRRWTELSLLVSIYVYFALLSGFTVWQSTRIFYPGQIAWAILLAYPLLSVYDFIANRWRR